MIRWEYCLFRRTDDVFLKEYGRAGSPEESITFGRSQPADTLARLRTSLGPALKRESPTRLDLDPFTLDLLTIVTLLGFEGCEMVQLDRDLAPTHSECVFKRVILE